MSNAYKIAVIYFSLMVRISLSVIPSSVCILRLYTAHGKFLFYFTMKPIKTQDTQCHDTDKLKVQFLSAK